jgi:hypothetical protein
MDFVWFLLVPTISALPVRTVIQLRLTLSSWLCNFLDSKLAEKDLVTQYMNDTMPFDLFDKNATQLFASQLQLSPSSPFAQYTQIFTAVCRAEHDRTREPSEPSYQDCDRAITLVLPENQALEYLLELLITENHVIVWHCSDLTVSSYVRVLEVAQTTGRRIRFIRW